MSSKNRSNEMWEKIEVDEDLVRKTSKLAKRDLKTAEHVYKEGDYDWSFAISYNAMLQAGRALMFMEGVRPKGEFKHVSVVEFVKTKFGDQFAEKILFMFNKIRKKRHTAVYEQVDLITQAEAENTLKMAREFVDKVDEILDELEE
jgi:uncharacterized protein (UPF0332 family)